MEFRRQRMIAYGLNPDTAYSARDQVNQELKFAEDPVSYTHLTLPTIDSV